MKADTVYKPICDLCAAKMRINVMTIRPRPTRCHGMGCRLCGEKRYERYWLYINERIQMIEEDVEFLAI